MENPLLFVALLTSPLFLFGGVFFCIGIYRAKKAKNYQRTNGVIIQGAKKKLLKLPFLSEKLIDKLYERQIVSEPQPTVSYEVEGQTYTYKSSISQQPALRIGREVDVLYNPEQPNQAIIDTFAQRGSVFTLVGTILLIIPLIILGVATYIIVF